VFPRPVKAIKAAGDALQLPPVERLD